MPLGTLILVRGDLLANYRNKWFANNKPVLGKYRCAHCKKMFPKEQIDIDHIIPKKYGGTDDLSNLQALCYHCNRSKQADLQEVPKDLIVNGVRNGIKGAINSIINKK